MRTITGVWHLFLYFRIVFRRGLPWFSVVLDLRNPVFGIHFFFFNLIDTYDIVLGTRISNASVFPAPA